MCSICSALSLIYVEQIHFNRDALPKYRTTRCKIIQQRSTRSIVQRSIVIQASAEKIYPHIVDLKQWKNWGVWFARDPKMNITYSGTTAALGMKSSWKSELEGNGEMTITALVRNKSVTYSLYFPDFDIQSTGELQLVENEGKTTVTWMDYGDVGSNPINRYFALMMDSMIGPDFEQGLSNLKTVVESQS